MTEIMFRHDALPLPLRFQQVVPGGRGFWLPIVRSASANCAVMGAMRPSAVTKVSSKRKLCNSSGGKAKRNPEVRKLGVSMTKADGPPVPVTRLVVVFDKDRKWRFLIRIVMKSGKVIESVVDWTQRAWRVAMNRLI